MGSNSATYLRILLVIFVLTSVIYFGFLHLQASKLNNIYMFLTRQGYAQSKGKSDHATGEPPNVVDFERLYNTSASDNKTQNNTDYLILWYNVPYYVSPYLNNYMANCPVRNCKVSIKNSDLAKSDMVIISHDAMPRMLQKKAGQYWTLFSLENPSFMYKAGSFWTDKFDFTMTYRYDSDFTYPYGKLMRRKVPLARNYSENFRKKFKFAMWMSGHCPVPSKRKQLVRELQKYIQVDMYGTCGNNPCGKRSPFISYCHYNFARDYKFYLAFENGVCIDYTTEKLFNLYTYDLGIIAVTNGPNNSESYLPEGSFVNGRYFKTAKELAMKLIEIGSDENKYNQYLREKDRWYDIRPVNISFDVMCQVCQKLNKLSGSPVKSIHDVWTHLQNKSCENPVNIV